ncbi:MAG: HAD family hydrolase [Candidatus Caldarchaeum sp.]|nr:HAD family hydrolase [Candidatus Caldarchaeum sp.]
MGGSQDTQRFRAVFLDVDGTLYRSREYEEHLLTQAVDVIAEMLGLGRGEAFRKLSEVRKSVKTVSKSVEVLGIDRRVFYDRLAQKVTPSKFIMRRDDVVDIMRTLRRRGIFVGLHTNSGRRLAEKILACLGISRECYDLLVTSDDAEPKPSLEGYRLLLEKSEVPASQALYVGDRCDVELAPAKKIGLRTAVIYEHACECADYLLNDLKEILSLV